MPAERVVVDTSVWVDGLRGGRLANLLRDLLVDGRALLPSPVVTELLVGARPGADQEAVETVVASASSLVPEASDYESAGRLGQRLRRKGATVGTVDLLLAALAIRVRAPLWSLDRHFTAMARHEKALKLFEPS
jgi:predicted nucleic acid-binding protein